MPTGWFTTTTSINWLTIFLVGLTLFMVGGGAHALLEVDRKQKDSETTEFFLVVAKRLGVVLLCVGAGLWLWLSPA